MVTALAVNGFKEVIVPDCPYCHKKHLHSEGSVGARMADCLQGEYVLDFGGTSDKESVKQAEEMNGNCR